MTPAATATSSSTSTSTRKTHISNEVRCHARMPYQGRSIRCWRRAREQYPVPSDDNRLHLICSKHLEDLPTLTIPRHLTS